MICSIILTNWPIFERKENGSPISVRYDERMDKITNFLNLISNTEIVNQSVLSI
jgi:hypothetical protein